MGVGLIFTFISLAFLVVSGLALVILIVLLILPRGKLILTNKRLFLHVSKRLPFTFLTTKKSIFIDKISAITHTTFFKRSVLIIKTSNDKIRVRYKFQKSFYTNILALLNSNVSTTNEFEQLVNTYEN